MFSWAKELLSPTVQTGKPVTANGPEDRRNSKSSNAEGEMTEEGFVCVGKSSFYKSPEMPAIVQSFGGYPQENQPMHNYNSNYPPGQGVATMYPVLPFQPSNMQMSAANDNSDLVRRIPFKLRSGLTTAGGNEQRQQKPYEVYLSQFRNRYNYDYDFNFERGVIRELNQQQSPGCY